MPSIVITRSTCERCGHTAEMTGAHSERAPSGWADVSTREFDPGASHGWGKAHRSLLCPSCLSLVLAALGFGGVDVPDAR